MDLIVTLITVAVLIWFIQNFFTARTEILEEKRRKEREEHPTLTIESVDDNNGNTVLLVYEYWTNEFICQGTTNEEVLKKLYERFTDKVVTLKRGEIEVDLLLSYPSKKILTLP